MKHLLIMAVILLTFGTSYAQSANNVFDGVWVGQGHQLNDNGTWSIKLTIKGDNTNIDYPSLGCNAKLTKVNSDNNKLYLSEKMIVKNNCIDNGKIELEWLSPNELRYKWSYSNGLPGAYATLYKFN